jgi:hypothetical protein
VTYIQDPKIIPIFVSVSTPGPTLRTTPKSKSRTDLSEAIMMLFGFTSHEQCLLHEQLKVHQQRLL